MFLLIFHSYFILIFIYTLKSSFASPHAASPGVPADLRAAYCAAANTLLRREARELAAALRADAKERADGGAAGDASFCWCEK